MDPVTALAEMVTALATTYGKILDATPDAEKATIAKWIVEDMTKFRTFFHLPV